MKRIIVFRFHKLPEICIERVNLLKKLNPSTKIFGLFGGESEDLRDMQTALDALLENIFSIAEYAPAWKWRFSDLALHQWFINVGVTVPFDVVHMIEWDLLLCRPLETLYSHIASGSVGLTAIRSVKDVESNWVPTATEPFSLEWKKLINWARRAYSYSTEPFACLGPGYCVPRSFLEAYSSLAMPELSSDELRLPLAAQLLGFPVADTRLCRAWFMEEECKIFNTIKREVLTSTIAQELRKAGGRKAFHPFRESLADIAPLIPIDFHQSCVA
jgi:hypothetical protein